MSELRGGDIRRDIERAEVRPTSPTNRTDFQGTLDALEKYAEVQASNIERLENRIEPVLCMVPKGDERSSPPGGDSMATCPLHDRLLALLRQVSRNAMRTDAIADRVRL
jgi:hypothetical protein